MRAPYYAALFATAALARGKAIFALEPHSREPGNGTVSAYVIVGTSGKVMKVVLFNSEYLEGQGKRKETLVKVTRLGNSQSTVTNRLTTEHVVVSDNMALRFAGQMVKDGSSEINGTVVEERFILTDSVLEVSLAASEAMLLEIA